VGFSDGFAERVCNTEGCGVGLVVGDDVSVGGGVFIPFGDMKVPPPHQQHASSGVPIPLSQQPLQVGQPLLSLFSYHEHPSP